VRRFIVQHKACRAITDGGLFTDTGVNERGKNDRQNENDIEMKTVSYVKGPENRQELVQTRLRRKGVVKEKDFEFRVKLMRGDRGQVEGLNQLCCRVIGRRWLPQLFGYRPIRECQTTGDWWVKDLSVTLRHERT